MALVTTRESPNVKAHRGPSGKGVLGGKGDSAVLVDRLPLKMVRKPLVHVLSSYFFQLYLEGGLKHPEVREHLGKILDSLGNKPISVRSSGEDEVGHLPTAGRYISYMLPNNNPDREKRLDRLIQAIEIIFGIFKEKRGTPDIEIGIEVRAVEGVQYRTNAGRVYHPFTSGVADSKLLYPCGTLGIDAGFARVAFGHGYSTVVTEHTQSSQAVPILGINTDKPVPGAAVQNSQRFFWAVNMDRDEELRGEEMETMSRLSIANFADPALLGLLGEPSRCVRFVKLATEDRLGYSSGLRRMMEDVAEAGYPNFQLEYAFNVSDGRGIFDLLQLRILRDISPDDVLVPVINDGTILSSTQVQGHGVIPGIKYVLAVSPFTYDPENHDVTVRAVREFNSRIGSEEESFVLVCPGRIGTTNRDWGLHLDFADISNAAVIVEYGYDVSGSSDITVTSGEMTGGIYGSHFLYAILGGMAEDERVRRLRVYGSQGTHFLTNLIAAGSLYVLVKPGQDSFDPSLFSGEGAKIVNGAVILREFPEPVIAYGNLFDGRCVVQ